MPNCSSMTEADIVAELEPLHGNPRPRRVRRARQRGQDRLGQVRPRARDPLLRHLPRHADGLHRGRAEHSPGSASASTTEFGETTEPVVGLITEWMSAEGLQERAGGRRSRRHDAARRLSSQARRQQRRSRAFTAQDEISERHRHRYEVNVHYREPLEKGGLVFSGMSPGRPVAGNCRAAGPPVVHRRPVPSRAQEPAVRAASVVRRLHRGRAQKVAAGLSALLRARRNGGRVRVLAASTRTKKGGPQC